MGNKCSCGPRRADAHQLARITERSLLRYKVAGGKFTAWLTKVNARPWHHSHFDDFSRCVVAYNTYHALRNNYSRDIDDAVSSSDFTDLLLIACEVMRYFSGEILTLTS